MCISHKSRLVLSIIFLLCSAQASYTQRRQQPEDQVKLARQFFPVDRRCRDLLHGKQWKEAEAACKAAVQLADRFTTYREIEKMMAYEHMGQALAGQNRYDEAISYYLRALDQGRPRVDDTDAEVGEIYARIAMAYHGMQELDKAREFYRRAAKTYRAAYSNIDKDEVTEEGVQMKQWYLKNLKSILEYHRIAAMQAGQQAEAEEIKKQIEMLPQ